MASPSRFRIGERAWAAVGLAVTAVVVDFLHSAERVFPNFLDRGSFRSGEE